MPSIDPPVEGEGRVGYDDQDEDFEDDQDECTAGASHVFPLFGRGHRMSFDCWCEPRAEFDECMVAPVWVHNCDN